MTNQKKIEDVLDILSPDSTFEPKSAIDLGVESSVKNISFPQILDFAFPQGSGQTPVVELGEITYVGDGVIHIKGLEKATIDEIVDIKTSQEYMEKALILGIGEDKVEAVVLGDYTTIKRGDQVRSTGKKLTIPTGEKLLSRGTSLSDGVLPSAICGRSFCWATVRGSRPNSWSTERSSPRRSRIWRSSSSLG